jgi:hypothetical protein
MNSKEPHMVNSGIRMFWAGVSNLFPKSAILDQRPPCKTFCGRRWAKLAVLLSLSELLCGTVDALPTDPPLKSAISDPLEYCTTAGTRDNVRELPRNLRKAAAASLGLPPAAADSGGYFWRCMGGAVYVCAVGANIPCQSKADGAHRNAGAVTFCREKRDAEFVPAYATGHRTIYEWRCVSGAAVRGKVVARLDSRGFQVDFWHRLTPTGADKRPAAISAEYP